MISLKEFMELVDYRITEGSEFTWNCFGNRARPYTLSAWNGEQDGWSFNITFDTNTQVVYLAEACDYKNTRAYRLINPDYVDDYREYGERRDPGLVDTAWDDVEYIDLEVDDDFIQKGLAIIAGETYDTRISMPVDFSDEELLKYMKLAHEQDITFNQFVERALRESIDRYREEHGDF